MGRPKRVEQFHALEVCIVHAVQRCVRRAFLAGLDEKTGRDYSYRREWIRRRLEALASVFAVDVLTYAVMSNHLHVILRNRPDVVRALDDEEVALRWLRVFPGRRLDEHLGEPTDVDVQTLARDKERIAQIRVRLSDISWFMRALAEPIARMANRQDECTGRFWEGRFKAQRIVDEAGLLACSMYVDLNPVRAALAESPEQARHTSAYDRLQAERGAHIDSAAFDLVAVSHEEVGRELRTSSPTEVRQKRRGRQGRHKGRRVLRDSWLAPVTMDRHILSSDPQVHRGGLRASDKGYLTLGWKEYAELLRWTARQRGPFVAGKVPARLSELLGRLGIEPSMWRDLVWNFKRYFGRSSCAGSPGEMAAAAQRVGKRWHRGQRRVRGCFATTG